MTLKLLFSAPDSQWDAYETRLAEACAAVGLKVDLARDHAPEDVDYIVYAPNPALKDFSPFIRCKAVLSLWAGVESIAPNPTLTQPLARLVDTGLTEGMTEWVTGHVLRYHLGMDRYIRKESTGWEPHVPPLAKERPVTILGLGALGSASAKALANLGFQVSGWSSTLKEIDGITCYAGPEGLTKALTTAHIVVLLLPLTKDTENTLNAKTLAALPRGAMILNPGRGGLIDDEALLAALESGHVAHATLDVFRVEPLPQDHPYWAHPRVTVTPHIASATRPDTAARQIADNIRRSESGEPLMNLVERARGY